ncbi:ATP-binding protein [Marinomonas sp. E8]|uniref:ATP-binding protein n=1 Tax=Marinomonas algarum TaxID=2883105 RepID=A0A9X1RUZ3_9GAMM|nr:ATP-binding protein [Marinomonas algarum]MCB5163014.1 ATP-binding protein [Marinomonas algarum]
MTTYAELDFEERLSLQLESEILSRTQTKIQRLKQQAKLRLDALKDRYQNSSTIVISQLPVKEWYNMIDNATVADALMDSLVHNSHRIELGGESMRKLAQSSHLE